MDEKDKLIKQLLARIEALEALVKAQAAEIAELKRRKKCCSWSAHVARRRSPPLAQCA